MLSLLIKIPCGNKPLFLLFLKMNILWPSGWDVFLLQHLCCEMIKLRTFWQTIPFLREIQTEISKISNNKRESLYRTIRVTPSLVRISFPLVISRPSKLPRGTRLYNPKQAALITAGKCFILEITETIFLLFFLARWEFNL